MQKPDAASIATAVFPGIISYWQGKKPDERLVKDCAELAFKYADALIVEFDKRYPQKETV